MTLDRNYRSTQAILAAANGVIGLAKERFTKNLWTDRTSGARPQLVTVRDEADQARYIVERVLENREVRHAAEAAGGAVPHIQPQRSARGRTDPAQHPVRQVRRPQVPRRRACQGHAGAAAVRREPARPCRRLPAAAPDARGSGRHPRSACSITWRKPPIRSQRWRSSGPATRRRRLEGFVAAVADLRYSEWPADLERARLWYEPHLDRIHEDAETRRADLDPARADRRAAILRASASSPN